MKVLIFGGSGMLGHKLVQQLQTEFEMWTTIHRDLAEFEWTGLYNPARTLANFDVLDQESVVKTIEKIKPDVVINAVGIVKQRPAAKDVETTLLTNSIFPQRVAGLAEAGNFRFINISTDCVFDGKKGFYTEDDLPDAADLYGKSKHLGEVAGKNCLTLRTSIIGRELNTKQSLVEWFLSQEKRRVKGFKNAVFSGFPTIVLSDIIKNLIRNFKSLSGLYHAASQPISKFDLLEKMKSAYNLNVEIEPENEFKIDRSLDGRKFNNETGFAPESWDAMIRRMADDPTPYEKWKTTQV